MPSKIFVIECDPPKQLKLSWNWGPLFRYQDIRLDLGDEPLGSVSQEGDLQDGWEIQMKDGSVLLVELKGSRFRILQDGKPLRGYSANPDQAIKNAYVLMLTMGGIQIALGLIGGVFQGKGLSYAMGSVGLGLGSLLLGFLIRRESLLALAISICWLIFNTLFFEHVFDADQAGAFKGADVIIAALLTVTLVQAGTAIYARKKLRKLGL